MNNSSTLLQFNPCAFQEFLKLSAAEKQWHIRNKGLLVDKDQDDERCINLYFIEGFFVEEVLCKEDNSLIELLPYTRGYKAESFVEVKQVIVPKFIRGN
jgi:hypothetical protein